MTRQTTIYAVGTLLIFALSGACSSELPAGPNLTGSPPPSAPTYTALLAPDDLASETAGVETRLFTGRDSFGVAVHLKGDGEVVDKSGDCFQLDGSGHGTHLGRFEIGQTYCASGGTADKSPFSYSGQNGQSLSGWTQGLSTSRNSPTILEGNVAFTDGEVQAVTRDIQLLEDDDGPKWNGTVTIEVEGNRFSLEVDGWLLHHVNDRFTVPTAGIIDG